MRGTSGNIKKNEQSIQQLNLTQNSTRAKKNLNPSQPILGIKSFEIIGDQSVKSESTETLQAKKGFVLHANNRFQQIKNSEYIWDYFTLSWIFGFILATKDDSQCLDSPALTNFSLRMFFYIDAFTTVGLLFFFFVIIFVFTIKFKNQYIKCFFIVIFGGPCVILLFFKIVWSISIFYGVFLNIQFEKCSDSISDFILAYFAGAFYMYKHLSFGNLNEQTSKGNFIPKQQMKIKQLISNQQRKLVQDYDRSSKCSDHPFLQYYLKYFKYQRQHRNMLACFAIFGIYIALKDTQSLSLKSDVLFKAMLITCSSFEALLAITLILRHLSRRLGCLCKPKPVVVSQQSSQQTQRKDKNNYVFCFITKTQIVCTWQFMCLALSIAMFITAMLSPLSSHSSILTKYLLLFFLSRLIYYRNILLVYFRVINYANQQFVKQVIFNYITKLQEELEEKQIIKQSANPKHNKLIIQQIQSNKQIQDERQKKKLQNFSNKLIQYSKSNKETGDRRV